ncbi:MAG: glycosyl hydrolase 115 family protein [Clostridia bacterium]|nr:glycosyl hydrolase 115 family protein [Clostridia bacterium]
MSFLFSQNTQIVSDLAPGGEFSKPVGHAVEILKRDMEDTLLPASADMPENRIVLEKAQGCPQESYEIASGGGEIRITFSDDLGGVYALLFLSREFLGIQPLDWWSGRVARRHSEMFVEVPDGTWTSPVYAVRFRGWFINDEVLFTGWHVEEGERAAVWRRVMETVLRMGGNMIIPGTDRGFDGEVLYRMAAERGLWITHHHSEPLGARMFSRVYPDLEPSYLKHRDLFEGLWRESVEKWKDCHVLWTIGFRGQGDHAFWDDDGGAYDTDEKRGALISEVMARQMEIVREKVPDAVFCTNLYGEIMDLYRKGCLQVPGEVIRVWGDNGFGKMVSRRQGNTNLRVNSMPEEHAQGANGVYYHVSFYDLQAANHITLLQNPPSMIAGELQELLRRGGGDYWNINTGSVKPHLYMLHLISALWEKGEKCNVDEVTRGFARTYYGSEQVADLFLKYGETGIHYGPNEDDRAGDQYYHWPLRALAHALLSGQTSSPVRSLLWASPEESFEGQLRCLAETVRDGGKRWNAFLWECERISLEFSGECRQLLQDSLMLAATIHKTGCQGLYDFCQSCLHAMRGDFLQAALWCDAALQCHREGLRALQAAEHGRFTHIYRNDCFTGVAVTVRVLETVRGYLRIRGDSEELYDWEKKYLLPPEDVKISLQSHRTVQLGDDELFDRLRGEVALKDIL